METQLMWEALLKKCGWDYSPEREQWIDPDLVFLNEPPPRTLDNIFKWVLPHIPILDRPELLIKWVWGMYALFDSDPQEELITACYSALIGGEHGE